MKKILHIIPTGITGTACDRTQVGMEHVREMQEGKTKDFYFHGILSMDKLSEMSKEEPFEICRKCLKSMNL